MISEGSAFLDRAGTLIAADDGFRRLMGLPPGLPTSSAAADAFRRRAEADPALAAFVSGEGPATVTLGATDGVPACQLARCPGDSGLLLTAAAAPPALGAAPAEYALQALALARLAGGFAHDVKNPLNAMALQLALLGDKISTASEGLASSCGGNLTSLKNQIGRINDVVRRQLDVSDPGPGAGFDAGALLADATGLFGHEARRRRIALHCEATPGAAPAQCDPARAARLVLGLLWRALASTPDGGRATTRAAVVGGQVQVTVEHTGSRDQALEWVGQVVGEAARELGGALREGAEGDVVRDTLVLPRERLL